MLENEPHTNPWGRYSPARNTLALRKVDARWLPRGTEGNRWSR
jgi:hypothetical protein